MKTIDRLIVLVFFGVSLAQSPALIAQTTTAQTSFHADVPVYKEQALLAGIEHRYGGPWEYFVGGGVSAFDCNQDRMPDLFIAGGENPAALYVNNSKPGGTLSFTQRTFPSSRLHHTADAQNPGLKNVLGSYPLDIDNDGILDVVVLRVGQNQLYKGGPDCHFTLANTLWRFAAGNAWTTSFAATFEPGASHPSMAFGNYVDRTAPGSPWGTCHDNELHRPDNNASHPDYSAVQHLTPGYCTLSLLFTDWNKSGRDALRVTNDRHYYRGGQEQLWRLDSGQYARQYSRADGWEPLVIWGMGIAEADLNADGYPEYALTSMGDTKLQSLDVQQAVDENRPIYEDKAWASGATAHRPYTGDDLKPSTGWHAQFSDVNNDANNDLFIAKGNVENMSDFARFDPDNLLLGGFDGSFTEQGLAAGIALPTRGRGASVVDLNADGLLDILVVNRGDNVSLFRHTGMAYQNRTRAGGNWLKLELSQPGTNPFAIGSRISIKTGNHVQERRIQVGGGHASGSLGFVHVGLGVAERAVVRIQWPDGQWSSAYKVFANHHLILQRDVATATQWFAPQ